MSALTIQEVRDHLGIDFQDAMTDRVLTNLLSASEAYVSGAIGENYPADDERVKTIQKFIIADLYDNRELSDKIQGATKRLIDSMILQVKLEMRLRPPNDTSGGENDEI